MKLCKGKIDVIMARKQLSINELAIKSGVARVTIRHILLGKRNPRPVTVGKIAKALGVDVTEIIEM